MRIGTISEFDLTARPTSLTTYREALIDHHNQTLDNDMEWKSRGVVAWLSPLDLLTSTFTSNSSCKVEGRFYKTCSSSCQHGYDSNPSTSHFSPRLNILFVYGPGLSSPTPERYTEVERSTTFHHLPRHQVSATQTDVELAGAGKMS